MPALGPLLMDPHTEPGSQAAPAKPHTPPASMLCSARCQQWLLDGSLGMADTLAQSWGPPEGLGRDGHPAAAQRVQARFHKVLQRK